MVLGLILSPIQTVRLIALFGIPARTYTTQTVAGTVQGRSRISADAAVEKEAGKDERDGDGGVFA